MTPAPRGDGIVGLNLRTGVIELPSEYDELTPGHEFPPVHYALEQPEVDQYIQAVGAERRGHVPPLAVAARAIASLGELIALPPGTIHVSQEFEYAQLVAAGSHVTCIAKVHRKLTRGSMRMLTLELSIVDEAGAEVQKGRSTIVLPEA